MAQIYFNVFCLYILPVIIGFVFGIMSWKRRKTHIYTIFMIIVGIMLWSIIPNIHTRGSEMSGLILWMYAFLALAFAFIELIKYIVRKK